MYNTRKIIWLLLATHQLLFDAVLPVGTSAEEINYVVEMPNCRIPDYNPFDPSIRGIPYKRPPFNCGSLPPLTSVTGNYGQYDSRNGSLNVTHTLNLHLEYFHYYNIPTDDFECCYSVITRDDTDEKWPDNDFTLSECVNFTQPVTFNDSEEFIWVQCYDSRTIEDTDPQYVNVHAFIGSKPEVMEKLQKQKRKKYKLNVLIIGFDSISRLNLMRTMPKTVKHLSKNAWYALKGYNKIGDNTLPNLMAAFAGMNVKQVEKMCWQTQTTPFDGCPLIWKNFAEAGYVTAYGEDYPKISTFNYFKSGFKNSPTDYYMRPFFLAARDVGPTIRYRGGVACYGPTNVADHVFNYSLDFLKSFSDFRTFSIFWQNSFSHEDLNGPSAMDDAVLDYFKKLAESGVLNTTMVVFMSDHGFRFGAIRSTFLGYVEERLPFLYIWLPEWYKESHPHRVHNLERNQNLLTSPYDLYLTLLAVLGERGSAAGCKHCRDLFRLVRWNRTCADAGITDHWCTCAEYSDIDPNSPLAVSLATLMIETIHQYLIDHSWFIKPGTACARLHINNMLSVKKKTFSDNSHSPAIVVAVETYPGFAHFEATLSFSGSWKVVGEISRTNRYAGQCDCIIHIKSQKYCFCIPYHG